MGSEQPTWHTRPLDQVGTGSTNPADTHACNAAQNAQERMNMSQQVHSMFSRIAERYDRANRWMSFGTDQGVRRRAVAMSGIQPGDALLDCAAGTGELTLLFHDAMNGRGRVVGSDFNADMLSLAEQKSRDRDAAIEWRVEDSQDVDFEDEGVDFVSIAYDIPNEVVPHRALRRM